MTNLDITKSSFSRTIFFTPVIVKYLEKELDIYNETSLCRTNFASPLALRYIDVPLIFTRIGSVETKGTLLSFWTKFYFKKC